MIDTHCHLLPEIDDGPRTMTEAVGLARELVSVGVRRVICTPHLSRRYGTDHDLAATRMAEVGEALESAGIRLGLSLAAEVASTQAIEVPPEELRRRTIGTRHLLVELERETPAGIVGLILDRVEEIGCDVVLAHPERCAAVREQLRLIDSARERGALIQVVAPSLTGRWGKASRASAWNLVHSGRADLLASDAHRPGSGPEHLSVAVAQLAKHVAPRRVVDMTISAPARLLGASSARSEPTRGDT